MPEPTQRQGFFYGWAIVGTVFVTMAISAGLGFYNASVILSAAVDELDADVGVVSGATGVFFGLSGIIGFGLAPYMDRVDLRWFYVPGGFLGAGALYGLRWVNSVLDLYIFFILFSVGYAMAGIIPGTTLVARWFDRRRPVALSIASTGLSVGGVLITPIVAGRIVDGGLAESGPRLAMIWFVGMVPLTLMWIRSKPSDLGLEPDGVVSPDVPVELTGATFGEALHSRYFRGLSVAYVMIFLAQVGGIAQLFNHVSERLDDGVAKTILSTLAFSSITGRLLGGLAVVKLGARPMTIVLSVVQAGALTVIAIAESRGVMMAGAAIFGLSIGNLLMLQPLLLAEAFGVKAYSRVYSFNTLIATVGIAGGPFLLGVLRDAIDYRAAFLAAAAANIIGLIAVIAAGHPRLAQAIWKGTVAGPASSDADDRSVKVDEPALA